MTAEIKQEKMHDVLQQETKQDPQQNVHNASLTQILSASSSYQGPLPPAYMMKQYKDVEPTAPEIILREFESNSAHIRNMEKIRALEEVRSSKFGQRAAFAIACIMLGIMIWTISLKVYLLAGASCILGILSLAKTFIVKEKK